MSLIHPITNSDQIHKAACTHRKGDTWDHWKSAGLLAVPFLGGQSLRQFFHHHQRQKMTPVILYKNKSSGTKLCIHDNAIHRYLKIALVSKLFSHITKTAWASLEALLQTILPLTKYFCSPTLAQLLLHHARDSVLPFQPASLVYRSVSPSVICCTGF